MTAGPFPARWPRSRSLPPRARSLAVCTNKREHLSRKLLEELDLARYFAGLAGRDTFPVSKPDPGHLTGVIALAGGDPSRAVMVGDSEIDLAHREGGGSTRHPGQLRLCHLPPQRQRRRRR